MMYMPAPDLIEIQTCPLLFKGLLRSKNIFILSSGFKTLFTKQSPSEILGLNFEKTVYSNSCFA